jgi:hypothetical protein
MQAMQENPLTSGRNMHQRPFMPVTPSVKSRLLDHLRMIAALGDEQERQECRELTELLMREAEDTPAAVNFATAKPGEKPADPADRSER